MYRSPSRYSCGESGCFRCHNGNLRDAAGETITRDCNACHVILVENEPARSIEEILREAVVDLPAGSYSPVQPAPVEGSLNPADS